MLLFTFFPVISLLYVLDIVMRTENYSPLQKNFFYLTFCHRHFPHHINLVYKYNFYSQVLFYHSLVIPL